MKPSKFAGACSVGFLCLALGIAIMVEHRNLNSMRLENTLLRRQVEELETQVQLAAADNAQFSNSLAKPQLQEGTSVSQEQFDELLRLRGEVGQLRGEVGRLHLIDRQAEELRRARMKSGQRQLPEIEAQFTRATKLHSEGLVSDTEMKDAQFNADLFRALARGDEAGVTEVRRQRAQDEMDRATDLLNRSLISQTDYNEIARLLSLY